MNHVREKEKEFEALFRKNYLRLYHYALDFVENEEVAKDIVSELFGDLWKQYAVWQPDNADAYLSRSLRNRCLNYLKHLQVEQNALQYYIKEKTEAIDPDAAFHEERMRQVQQVMNELTPRTRFILEQRYVEGKKYSELASLLDTSVGMIHKHISKALAIFRKTLNNSGTEP